jgi:hypothetical protein
MIDKTGTWWKGADFGDEAEPKKLSCRPCRGRLFELGVAFSRDEDGDVRWITLGERCVRCGVLGAFADWKVDYAPTEHLLSQT